MGVTRKLDKESLMYCYPIYKNSLWSVLIINNPILKSMYYLYYNSNLLELE